MFASTITECVKCGGSTLHTGNAITKEVIKDDGKRYRQLYKPVTCMDCRFEDRFVMNEKRQCAACS